MAVEWNDIFLSRLSGAWSDLADGYSMSLGSFSTSSSTSSTDNLLEVMAPLSLLWGMPGDQPPPQVTPGNGKLYTVLYYNYEIH